MKISNAYHYSTGGGVGVLHRKGHAPSDQLSDTPPYPVGMKDKEIKG